MRGPKEEGEDGIEVPEALAVAVASREGLLPTEIEREGRSCIIRSVVAGERTRFVDGVMRRGRSVEGRFEGSWVLVGSF